MGGSTENKSAAEFFTNVFDGLDRQTIEAVRNTRLCIIQHIILNSKEFLKQLNAVFKDMTVFAKPKSINNECLKDLIKHGIDVKEAKRNCDPVKHYLNGDKTTPTVLCDIGGYFTELAQIPNINILGIVEDTENGQQKYEKIVHKLQYPVVSVARSPLKNYEDNYVGKSIVHGADTILRSQNILLEHLKNGVIGYGKVGAGIVGELKRKDVKPLVVEKDPLRMLTAVSNNVHASSKNELLSEAEVLFSATGSKALDVNDLKNLRKGAYVASVTSSDDEFDLTGLSKEFDKEQTAEHITKYTGEKNHFHLINEGNAVNFLYSSAVGPFIYLVMSEIMASAALMSKERKLSKSIVELPVDRNKIAASWLSEFTGLNILRDSKEEDK